MWENDRKQADLPYRKLTKSRDFPQTVQNTSIIVEEADVGEQARLQGLSFQWERKAELEHWKAWSARQRGLKLWVNKLSFDSSYVQEGMILHILVKYQDCT